MVEHHHTILIYLYIVGRESEHTLANSVTVMEPFADEGYHLMKTAGKATFVVAFFLFTCLICLFQVGMRFQFPVQFL